MFLFILFLFIYFFFFFAPLTILSKGVNVLLSGLGCYVGNVFMGCLGYADDAVLLTPTLFAMKKMLKICDEFGIEYNVTFNASKYQFIHFPANKSQVVEGLLHNDIYIKCVPYSSHLGHIVGINSVSKVIDDAIHSFNVALNSILNMFTNVYVSVKYKLFKSYCMPLYGCVLWDFDSVNINQFYVTWRKAIRRLFNLSNRTHSRYIHLICNDVPVKVQLYKRFNKFMYTLLNNGNPCVELAGKLVSSGSNSNVSKNINIISRDLKCNYSDVLASPCAFTKYVQSYVTSCKSVEDNIVCGNICDLMFIRDRNLTRFCSNEINEMLEYLCTS